MGVANMAPDGADNAISLAEDGEYIFTAADFGFSDGNGNTLLAVKVTLPAAGHLLVNGIPVNADDFISIADINNSLFKYVADPNGYGAAHASFAFQVQDNGGGGDLDLSPNTMTINVDAVADTPSISAATTNEDTQSTSGLVISRSAADGAEVTHFKITNIQHGTLFLQDGTTVVSNGDFISFADADAGLRFTPDANFHGTGTFSVQASLGNSDAGLGGGAIVASVDVASVSGPPINGDGSDNALVGTADDETIDGKAGNDTISGDLAGDTLIGGDGNDRYELGGYVPLSIVEGSGAGSGVDTITSTITRSLELYANVENLTLGGTGAIDGTGNALANQLDGSQNAGANVLTGLGGNDFYFVGAGDSVVEQVGGGTDTVETDVTHTLSDNVENLTLVGNSAITGTGNGLANRLDGSQNAGANVLTGLGGDDTYFVGAGDSVVEAIGGGTDLVYADVTHTLAANVENLALIGTTTIDGIGNELANVLDGNQNSGANLLTGLAGDDTYFIGAGDGVVEAAGGGTDVVNAYVSHTLAANVENLVLRGNSAIAGTGNGLANSLDGTVNTSANVLEGLAGDDTYFVGAGDSVIEAVDGGTDRVYTRVTQALAANVEELVLLGSVAIDGIGNALANRLDGSQNSGANALTGFSGNDIYIVGAGDTVVEAANGGTDIIGAYVAYTLAENVETLVLLGTSAIDGTGNGLTNTLDGTQSSGANVLAGLGGDDTYFVGAGDTVVEAAGAGTDLVYARITQTLAANVETLVLLGSAAIDGTGNGLANTLDGNQNTGANVLTGLAGNDTYFVGAGDSVVEAAGGGTDTVYAYVAHTLAANVETLVLVGNLAFDGTGNGLANRLDGTQSVNANVLKGLAGNDTYIVGTGDAVVEAAGGGTDVVGTQLSYTLTANVENLVLFGNLTVTGTGNGLANVLDGTQNSKGNVLKGMAGNDTYVVGAGDVVVEAANGGTSDFVRSLVSYKLGANVEHLALISTVNQNGTGNTLANSIFGNAKNNVLDGGAGGDNLNGAAGNDILIGGTGVDSLNGGAGSDIFVFNAPLSPANGDFIADFNHVADNFRLENAVMKALGGGGALKAGFFFAGTHAHDADDHIIYNKATGALYYDDDGVGAHAAIQLAYLTNKPVLAANDFAVI